MDDGHRNQGSHGFDDYRYQDGGYMGYAPNDPTYHTREEPNQEEDAQSDATEGHDEDDEVYEGEYQGIPHPDDKPKQKKAGLSNEFRDHDELIAEKMEDEEQLAHQYENIIVECGHGRFQWMLFIVLGLALMADGVEVFVVGFVLPSAEKDMCLSSSNKGMLGLIVYFGMMVGALFWSGLADKLGRKQCLIISLSINASFAFLSSFVQQYGFFLFCRLISGFGVGGSLPIVFAYFSEFLAREKRGEHLSWLCMFWMIGGLYASVMAWSIIPHYGWGFSMGTHYHFHSWRVFVVVCSLPCIASLVALKFMPESPRFLLEVSHLIWERRQLHRVTWNPLPIFQHRFKNGVAQIKTPKQVDEFIEIQSSTGTWYQRCFVRGIRPLKHPANFFGPPRRATQLIFPLLCSYYGLIVWFPDMIRYYQEKAYKSERKTFESELVKDFTFDFNLRNQLYLNWTFKNDRFIQMKMRDVTFDNSLFEDCKFEDVTSSATFFKKCTLVNTSFYNTDFYKYKFIDCEFMNVSNFGQKKGCQLDFEEDNDFLIYLVSFLGSLSVLPGNIISALLMDKLGRIKMIAGSMLISAVCCFFLFFGHSESAMIGWQCLFCGMSIAAWNALNVITVELYPTHKRATAFGILTAICKVGAILGNSIFASFVGITKVIPILLASSALVGGGLLSLRLPDTRDQVLM
uniref:Synaptic vesicle glycoprotein 2B n=1 Tax=Pseudonaja textilis TaxID=8673 RepID=A0A670Y333_PSETE